jgi:hypothetical protein
MKWAIQQIGIHLELTTKHYIKRATRKLKREACQKMKLK